MRVVFSVMLAAAGCSLAVDTRATQCAVDADCDPFDGYPSCQQGVCVPSCVPGPPVAQSDFANQCTTAQTFDFDNCERLQLCDDAALAGAFATSAPPKDLGMIPAPISSQATPSVSCASVAANLIYVTGSTNLPPLIKAVQPLLSASSPPYVAVFAPQTSCKGAASILDPDPAKHLVKNVVNNYAFYYDAAGAQQFCLLEPAGNTVDIGESDVYPESCNYQIAPNTADYLGPIQAIAIVVPAGSRERAISAEAVHLVFAAGGDDGRAWPWSDPRYYFTRSAGTGTMQLIARAVSVDPTMVWGIDRLSAANLVASMEAVDPSLSENAIGVLSSDFADRSRANLRVLAFQQRGQKHGYLPDASPASFDKANVRDGHYPIWGAIHLLAATQNGVPSEAARALITRLTVPKLSRETVSAIIESGFVPSCAMKVNHASELGPLTRFTPEFGCGCFYDLEVNGKTSCARCSGPGDCPSSAPACNYGYCEAQ